MMKNDDNGEIKSDTYATNLRVDVTVEHMTHHITQIIQGDDKLKKQISIAIQKALIDLDIDKFAKDTVNMHMRSIFNNLLEDARVKTSVQEFIIDSIRLQLMTAGVLVKKEALRYSREYRNVKQACEIAIEKNLKGE